jgi:hypothetical protein
MAQLMIGIAWVWQEGVCDGRHVPRGLRVEGGNSGDEAALGQPGETKDGEEFVPRYYSCVGIQ